MNKNMSKHAIEERLQRFNYIVDTIGIGETIAEHKELDQFGRENTKKLTSTGVIIVIGTDQKTIVTAYIASVQQAMRVYKQATGHKRVPNNLLQRLYNNEIIRNNQPNYAK